MRAVVVAAMVAASATAAAEPVAVIDLRPGEIADRQRYAGAVAAGLSRHDGVEALSDPAAVAALVGEPFAPHAAEGAAALAEARRAYGALDCALALPAADRAVEAFAAVQATGAAVGGELVAAYSYALLCADATGDAARAHRAAARLRALTPDRPPGVAEELWQRYPAIDATGGVGRAEVEINSTPTGAAIWVDHRPVGEAPVVVYLSEGEHLVAAAGDTGAGTEVLRVEGWTARSVVELRGSEPRWAKLAAWVAAWRAGERAPTPDDIARMLAALELRVAVLITRNTSTGNDQLELWGAPPGEVTAIMIGVGTTAELGTLAKLVVDTTAAWDRGERPDRLVATPAPAPEKKKVKQQPWWVYASVVGAVGLGAAVLLAAELADDHQRIEISYP